MIPGRIEVGPDVVLARGRLAVITGHAWTLPGNGNAIPAEDGRFEVDPKVGAVSAFLDLNDDGELDPTTEPSFPCALTHEWRCDLRTTAIRLHSRKRKRDGVWQQAVFATGFQLDDKGQVNPNFSFCTSEGQCAEHDGNPFANGLSSTATLTLCKWTDAPKQPPVSLNWNEAGSAQLAVLSAAPTPTVTYTASRDHDSLRITVQADETISRAIVWVGQLDKNRIRIIRWHSELSDQTRFSAAKGTFTTVLPLDVLTPDASVILQVARLDQTDRGFWRIASSELILGAAGLE